jgi:uncharacterized membrane protein
LAAVRAETRENKGNTPMILDIPHIIVTAIVIFAAIWCVNHTSIFDGMSKGRRTLVQFLILFVLLFIFNLVWPYGAGVR